MPNWCQNQVVISGPKPVIDEIKAVLANEQQGLLQWMRPLPEHKKDEWYDWCCSNWGTKWDIGQVFIGDDTEEDSIDFGFDTAWGPPIQAFRHWAQRDGRVRYRLDYVEPGMAFVGWDAYDGEFFDEDYREHGDDPAGYWDMANDLFGMEPDEEPEPLTEWYEQGVEDKGLAR